MLHCGEEAAIHRTAHCDSGQRGMETRSGGDHSCGGYGAIVKFIGIPEAQLTLANGHNMAWLPEEQCGDGCIGEAMEGCGKESDDPGAQTSSAMHTIAGGALGHTGYQYAHDSRRGMCRRLFGRGEGLLRPTNRERGVFQQYLEKLAKIRAEAEGKKDKAGD